MLLLIDGRGFVLLLFLSGDPASTSQVKHWQRSNPVTKCPCHFVFYVIRGRCCFTKILQPLLSVCLLLCSPSPSRINKQTCPLAFWPSLDTCIFLSQLIVTYFIQGISKWFQIIKQNNGSMGTFIKHEFQLG